MADSPYGNKCILFCEQSDLSEENEIPDCQRALTPEDASEIQTGPLAPFFFPRTVAVFIRF